MSPPYSLTRSRSSFQDVASEARIQPAGSDSGAQFTVAQRGALALFSAFPVLAPTASLSAPQGLVEEGEAVGILSLRVVRSAALVDGVFFVAVCEAAASAFVRVWKAEVVLSDCGTNPERVSSLLRCVLSGGNVL